MNLLFLSTLLFSVALCNCQILDFARTLDLSSSTAKAASVLVLPSSTSSLRLVYPICPLSNAHNIQPPSLSSLQVFLGQGSRHAPEPLPIRPVSSHDPCTSIYDVLVEDAVKQSPSSSNTSFTIRETFFHPSVPLPAKVSQASLDNFLVFNDNIFGPFSHYSISNARSRVRLPSLRFDILQNSTDYTLSSNTLIFAVNDTLPATSNPLTLAARYHAPESSRSFATSERSATISHWSGFVQFTDTLDLHNIGPALEAQFSRIIHQMATLPRDPNARAPSNPPPHTITTMGFRLPSESTNVEYYDAVGKVSTIRLRSTAKVSTNVELSPRFPLHGGNKYFFSVAHRLPLSSVSRRLVSSSVPTYIAKIPMSIASSIIGETTPSEKSSLAINLPRGAKDINVSVQGDGDSGFTCKQREPDDEKDDECSISFAKTKVVLDIFGHRQTVLINGGAKLTNQTVLVEYSVPLFAWLEQPLMVGLLLLGGYVVVYLVRRVSGVNNTEGKISI